MRRRQLIYSRLLLLAVTTLAAGLKKFLFSLVCSKGGLFMSKALLLTALTSSTNTILKLKTASTVLLAMET